MLWKQTVDLIERALQNNAALLLRAPPPKKEEKKCCYVIAATAEEMSPQSLGPLVNASKPAGATSIFLFLIGPPLFFFLFPSLRALREPRWGKNAELNWCCHTMKQVIILHPEHFILSLSQYCCATCKRRKGISIVSTAQLHTALVWRRKCQTLKGKTKTALAGHWRGYTALKATLLCPLTQ